MARELCRRLGHDWKYIGINVQCQTCGMVVRWSDGYFKLNLRDAEARRRDSDEQRRQRREAEESANG